MPTNLNSFLAMQLEEQIYTVVNEGDYLARRYEEEPGVNLYNMGGFFCEVYYNYDINKIVRTETFTDSEKLQDFAIYVKLNDLGL